MEENPIGLTDRQIFGFEYCKQTENLPQSADVSRQDNFGSIEFHGKSKQPPEIEILPALSAYNTYVIYYDADSFIVTLADGNQLDFKKITPTGWHQKLLALASPKSESPEIHTKINDFATIDSHHQEIVIGHFESTEKADVKDLTEIILWNTLAARFISELGIPITDESTKSMMSAITTRRQQVLDVLIGKTSGDLYEIATAPFAYTAPSQQSF